MSNANTLYASFVKAEATYRAQRIRDDIVGRHETARFRSRRRRRLA
ncbi:hypothetical protein [Nocardioides sp. CER19]|nr:hypothetical protein [Nocardioides sp. CER19]MDH2415419.1 hypothetical protein [Nocardioides sp. CER19]